MKTVVYTQRVEIIESYQERRDCADQQISEFIYSCGFLPMALPNNLKIAMDIMNSVKPIGIVFTGGNDLIAYGGNAAERDELEKALIVYSEKNQVPIYGFCRGMQITACHYGAKLEKIDGHVAVRHNIIWDNGSDNVNSFHNYGLKEAPKSFDVISHTDDGVIEEMKSSNGLIWCTMWHPEREMPFRDVDIDRLKKHFERENC